MRCKECRYYQSEGHQPGWPKNYGTCGKSGLPAHAMQLACTDFDKSAGLTLDDVKAFTRPMGGVSCIAVSTKDHWITTMCGAWQSGSVVTERPKRICRECQKNLGMAKPIERQEAPND